MHTETTQLQRSLMAAVAVLAGIYLVVFAPTESMATLKTVLDQALTRLVPHDHDFYPAVPILTATYSIWMVLFVLAGALSLVLAPFLLRGEHWARATALGLYAIPSVGGMCMVIPWFVLVLAEYPQKGVPPPTTSGMPQTMLVLFLGLAFYMTMLLADRASWKEKALRLVPFTFIGIVAGMVFMNAQHGVRYFVFLPDFPNESFFSPLGHFVTSLDHLDPVAFERTSDAPVYSAHTLALLLGGYMNYVSSALMILAIPLMALRRRAGWVIAMTAAVATAAVSFQAFLVRDSTEWLQGGFLSLALAVVLVLPPFRRLLVPAAPRAQPGIRAALAA